MEGVLAIAFRSMSEREAFGPNLRRLRVQRGISLESIAACHQGPRRSLGGTRTERSLTLAGRHLRARLRARVRRRSRHRSGRDGRRVLPLVPERRSARRARRPPAGGADGTRSSLERRSRRIGHRREAIDAQPFDTPDLPAVAFTTTGRIVAAVVDVSAAVGTAAAIATLLQLRWSVSLAGAVLAYHAVSLVALGSTPAVWAIETYLTNRHPSTTRAGSVRFLRLLHRSESSSRSS